MMEYFFVKSLVDDICFVIRHETWSSDRNINSSYRYKAIISGRSFSIKITQVCNAKTWYFNKTVKWTEFKRSALKDRQSTTRQYDTLVVTYYIDNDEIMTSTIPIIYFTEEKNTGVMLLYCLSIRGSFKGINCYDTQ